MQQISDLPRTKIIRNGEKVTPTFSREEMGRRTAKLREHMVENDIEAVLFTSYHNINYYSDFLYTSFGRTYGLVVTQDRHVTVSANIDAGMPWRRSFDDNIVYTDWQRDSFYYAVKEVLKDAGFSERQAGGRGRSHDPRNAPQGGGRAAGRRAGGRLEGDHGAPDGKERRRDRAHQERRPHSRTSEVPRWSKP